MFFCPNCNTKFDITNKNDLNLQKGGFKISEFLRTLLDDKITYEDLKKNKVNLNNIIRTKEYGKYSKHNKQKINNKINKLLKNVNKTNKNINKVVLICHNCGTEEDIIDGTCIYSKNNDDNIKNIKDYSYMKDSEIVPRTTNYICNNKKCQTHKNNSLKEAIFFKDKKNNYNIIYLCLVCNENWNHS
jgi:hypothetical protein